MVFTRKYNIVNNALGWGAFVIALLSYWLTLEPTASYWDCGEFIIQADKLEIGHPPGNPIFMLTARFFANFAPDTSKVALMVNAMSGLLSALTILLLFWTITHLMRRLIVRDGHDVEPSLTQYLVIMGSGMVGALAYAWSDTFWFSAVEGEVYAFSSFCTALVFWLILKWENRADNPTSDRYLVLIAYIIGVSIAVHLLNLLCIPAIVLVFAYRKVKDMNLKKSLLALLISFAIVVLVLYGLVPGFIKVSQGFELFCVNTLGMPFQSGVIIYTICLVGCLVWTIWEQYTYRSPLRVKISLWLSVLLSGMLLLVNTWLGALLMGAFAAVLFVVYNKRQLPRRVVGILSWSILTIFIGYSSYALILIRSNADTPMNQNSPDNVFALSSYLNREQYGSRPLLYGETPYSQYLYMYGQREQMMRDETGNYQTGLGLTPLGPVKNKDGRKYAKGVHGATPRYNSGFGTQEDADNYEKLEGERKDFYAFTDYSYTPVMQPEMNMLFPRMYSSDPSHIQAYELWTGMNDTNMDIVQTFAVDEDMDPLSETAKTEYKPTFGQNLRFFLDYQINHMYMRYFMWNFAGRQNDLCNQNGELDMGNWISGIPFIDNPRLGDQSLLPDELGKDNAGHNVFYMMPLILGLIGLLWQAFAGKRGIEQFWVVFFLFFMTGIAIVLYLNQTPLQPRERDYAFAGSFYAFAIWIGMGVAGLWRIFMWGVKQAKDAKKQKNSADATKTNDADEAEQKDVYTNEPVETNKLSRYCAIAACVIGLIVPLQMVSQTWDDHDRSGRTAAFDYGSNYLNSLEPNAIIFCNGDNDTFPLWYAQEVEGVRPDVKIINLSYLQSDWYANQQRLQSYDAAPVKFTAKPQDYAYDRLQMAQVISDNVDLTPTSALKSLKNLYSEDAVVAHGNNKYVSIKYPKMYIPVDKEVVRKRGNTFVDANDSIVDRLEVDVTSRGYMSLSEILMLDIIATNAANGWERPIYWASTVPNNYHLGLTPYMKSVGMAYQLTPTLAGQELEVRTSKAVDVINKYKWGVQRPGMVPYFDETAGRMLAGTRASVLFTTLQLMSEAVDLEDAGNDAAAKKKYEQALKLLQKMEKNLPETIKKYGIRDGMEIGKCFVDLGKALDKPKVTQHGFEIMRNIIARYIPYVRYIHDLTARFGRPSLSPETQAAPYLLYEWIEDYRKSGGDMKALTSMPAFKGVKIEGLKLEYENYMQQMRKQQEAASGQADGSIKGILSDIRTLIPYIVELQKMSPEEYSRQPVEVLQQDSVFIYTTMMLQEAGGDLAAMEDELVKAGVDIDRSTRLLKEFIANHPEILQQ